MNKAQKHYIDTSAMKDNTIGDNDEAIDLGRLFGILVDHKVWIFAVTALFAALSAIYVSVSTQVPTFKVEAKIQLSGITAINSQAKTSQNLVKTTLPQSEIAIGKIRSQEILGRVIDLFNLSVIITPKSLPIFGDLLMQHGVERPSFAQGWASAWANEDITVTEMSVNQNMIGDTIILRVMDDSHYKLFKEGEYLGTGSVNKLNSFVDGQFKLRVTSLHAAPGAEFELKHVSRMQAIENLRKSLSISKIGEDTGMLSLSMKGTQPLKTQRILNAILDLYYIQNIKLQIGEAPDTLEYFENQLSKARLQLQDARSNVNELEVLHYSEKLSLKAQSILDRIVNTKTKLEQLEFVESQLAEYYTPSQSTYAALLDKKGQRERELKYLKEQVVLLSGTDRKILYILIDYKVVKTKYLYLMNKIQEVKVAVANMLGIASIIDAAYISSQSVRPKKAMIVVISTMLGGMLSVGVILLRALFRRGVESSDQLEALGLPMYATIPLSDEQGKLSRKVNRGTDKLSRKIPHGLLAERNPADLAIEAIRGLRTSLHFAVMKSASNTLMITGPSPGIGKSFVAANLAAVCAQAGQRVLVIDADMRKGHIHSIFDEHPECGLSDYLTGNKSLENVIRSVSTFENFSYVARGIVPPNPSELLMSVRFQDFLATVSERFDLVVVYSPPILAVTDAAIIGKYVGTTLLVSRFEVNTPKEVEASLKCLAASGITVKGGILNAMKCKAAGAYGENYCYYNYSYK